MLIIAMLQTLPLVFLLVIALQRQPDTFRFVLSVLAYFTGLLFMWLVFPWDVTSVYYRNAIPFLLLAAIYTGHRRIRTPDQPLPKTLALFSTIIYIALTLFFGGLSGWAMVGYFAPADVIDLESPLRDGKYVIGHGGSSPFINVHAKVRPQNYALDILGLNAWGARSRLFGDSRTLENYAIYGALVYAPCDGEVLLAVDEFEDLVPPLVDRENLAGNHVLLACHGVEILLAHLKQGSVAVSAGQRVDTSTQLGQVGNSGNTSEPHLHIHAERGGEAGVILNGQAAAFTINNRYLVRGDIIRQ